MQYQLLAALVPSGLLNEQALETFQYLNHTVIHHLVAIWIQSCIPSVQAQNSTWGKNVIICQH